MTEAIKLTHSKPTGMRKSTKKKALSDTTAPVAVLACVMTLAETIGTNKPGKFRLGLFHKCRTVALLAPFLHCVGERL